MDGFATRDSTRYEFSHDIRQARELADRFVTILDGPLFPGTLDNLFEGRLHRGKDAFEFRGSNGLLLRLSFRAARAICHRFCARLRRFSKNCDRCGQRDAHRSRGDVRTGQICRSPHPKLIMIPGPADAASCRTGSNRVQYGAMNSPEGPQGRNYLRLSITDRCSFRCRYCRPESGPAESDLHLKAGDAELIDLVRLIHEETGIHKLRLSGGEPLMHPRVVELTTELRRLLPDTRLGITTNGASLAGRTKPLRKAGIDFVNVSLDSLDPTRFRSVTGGGRLDSTLRGIRAAVSAGFSRVRLNTVLIRRVNGDQLAVLVRFAAALDCEIRFIELMPIGCGAALWQSDYLAGDEALDSLCHEFEYLGRAPSTGTSARHRFLVDGRPAMIGMITPVSHAFCSRCDRLRMSHGGRLFACLRQLESTDLLTPLRAGDESEVRWRIRHAVRNKRDPGKYWPERQMVTIGG